MKSDCGNGTKYMQILLDETINLGDKKDYGNYRGISLISYIARFFGIIKIQEDMIELGDEQCGFRTHRCCWIIYSLYDNN